MVEEFKKYSINVEKQSKDVAFENEGELLLEDLPKEEIEKTKEDIELIKKAEEIVSGTLLKLGVENDFSINPDLVLIAKNGEIETAQISKKEKRRYFLGEKAFHKTIGGHVVISEDILEDRPVFFHALLHEFFHAASMNYGFLTKESKEKDRSLILKSGYKTYYDNQDGERSLFNAFNEAVTEELAREAARFYFDDSFHYEGIDEMFDEWNEVYPVSRGVLYAILLNISGGDEEKIKEIWEKIVRGYIKGTKMHLRMIEKYYGKDSLKILASMTTSLGDIEKNLRIQKFFYESDFDKREKIKKSIFLNI
jgi:hypothetical protein